MNNEIGLTAQSGKLLTLKSVDITAKLTGVLSEVTIKQQYKNCFKTNIETVYTFPLPSGAVLTSLEIEINGERLQGVVKANSIAEEDYEEAIVSGDTAVLLSKIDDGLYCLNLGNLLAGETAIISLSYAQLHQWQGESLRFYLPTTIAPKYGIPVLKAIEQHQLPQHSLSADYQLSFSISVEGLLAGAPIHCPTHSVEHHVTDQAMSVKLTHPQPMDRDFILELEKPKGYVGEGYWAKDGEHTVVLTSFIPAIEIAQKSVEEYQPRSIKIVVDCSGSMAGDSIEQARIALLEIVNQLDSQDYFNIILFGSNHQQLFSKSVIANEINIDIAEQRLQKLAANLGGTEMQAALNAAYNSNSQPHLATDLLLITDGQTWDEDSLLKAAECSEHRHFVVGVGSAVSESFLSKLAKVTGGASEFVTPNEDMSKRILQHFKRMKQSPIHNPQLCLSDKYASPLCFDPVPAHKSTLFLGDTINLLSHYEGYPPAKADFYFEGEFNEAENENEMYGATIPLTQKENDQGLLARLAAHDRLVQVSDSRALELAEQYQLITESTSYILVKQNQQTDELGIPELHHVPHQLPAGQSGFGSVAENIMFSRSAAPDTAFAQSAPTTIHCEQSDPLDVPLFLQKLVDFDDEEPHFEPTQNLASYLNKEFTSDNNTSMNEFDIIDLDERGEDEAIIEMLYQLEHSGYNEQKLVAAWLSLYNEFNPDNKFSRHVTRLIRVLCKELDISAEFMNNVREVMTQEISHTVN